MKWLKIVAVAAFAVSLSTGFALAEEKKCDGSKVTAGSCCDKAAKAGNKCEHACCVEAAKEGKVCKKCNKGGKKCDS